MMTFAKEIEMAAGDEEILSVVIGQNKDFLYVYDDEPHPARWISEEFIGVPLSWDVARPLLNYNYDDGYGGQDCHNVYVYTPTEVIGVHEYDGATWLVGVSLTPQSEPACGL